MFGFDTLKTSRACRLDLVAPAHVAKLQATAETAVQGRGASAALRLEPATLDGNHFRRVMEFTSASYEGESCSQIVCRRADSDRNWRAKSKNCASAIKSPDCSNRRHLPARARGCGGRHRKQRCAHGLLLLEPDHYVQLMQENRARRPRRPRCRAGRPPAWRHRRERHRGPLRRTPVRGAARNSEHEHTAQLAEKLRRRLCRSRGGGGTRSLNATVSIAASRSARRSRRSPDPRQGQPWRAVVGRRGRNRAEIFDPSAVDRAEESASRPGCHASRPLDGNGFTLPTSLCQPARRTRRELRALPAHAGQCRRPGAALDVPADREEHGLMWEIDRWVVGGRSR